LDVIIEGHDGSGVVLFLADLGGDFVSFKGLPILSGIFSNTGMKRLNDYMKDLNFTIHYEFSIRPVKEPPAGTPKRANYIVRVYNYPFEWADLSDADRKFRLMLCRLALRKMGEDDESIMIFSFWPDVIMLKEVGDPRSIAEYLELNRKELQARIILSQGRQNTNYAINIYACHPFFIQGIATMTNGENTAFVPIWEFLTSRQYAGYVGYDGAWLRLLKQSCRPLIIDGPNCIIGCLPDKTLFMVQDSKKLRPGIAGGRPGLFAFSSEMCGLDAAIPDRDKSKDFQPMKYDTVYVSPERQEVQRWNQWEKLVHPH
ncbi:MAG: glutamate synthase, partial [Deltaproteobacteria bacterium]|nr:glutamate synthase [Deltaproteobacteria bacterium]